jgi:ferredoxin
MRDMPQSTESPAVESDSPEVERAPRRLSVTFLRSNLVAEWDPTAHSLLDFAEQSGLSPPFCCRAGVCGTCLSTIKGGAVAYFEPPVIEPANGEILLCGSRPTEPVVIDI